MVGKLHLTPADNKYRLKNFHDSINKLVRYRRANPDGIYGLSVFADQSDREFMRTMLNTEIPEETKSTEPIFSSRNLTWGKKKKTSSKDGHDKKGKTSSHDKGHHPSPTHDASHDKGKGHHPTGHGNAHSPAVSAADDKKEVKGYSKFKKSMTKSELHMTHDNSKHTSGIRNQGMCGSCYAFASA